MAFIVAAFAVLVVVTCAGLLFYLAYNAKQKKAIQMPGDTSVMQGVQRAKTTSITYAVLGCVVLAMTPCCGGCTLMVGWSIDSNENRQNQGNVKTNSPTKASEPSSISSSTRTPNSKTGTSATRNSAATNSDTTNSRIGEKNAENAKPGIFKETFGDSSKDGNSKDTKAKQDPNHPETDELKAKIEEEMKAMRREAEEMRKKFQERRKSAN